MHTWGGPVSPTVIQAPAAGPPQLNVMPGEALILVDVRTIPAQSHDAIRSDLEALVREVRQETAAHYRAYDEQLDCRRDPRLDISMEILTDRPCTLTDPRDPVVRAAHWATRQIWQQPPVYGGVPGATDGTFLWALKDIPIITMGAGDREVPHQVDEWVDLDQLVDTARIYALTALDYLAAK